MINYRLFYNDIYYYVFYYIMIVIYILVIVNNNKYIGNRYNLLILKIYEVLI